MWWLTLYPPSVFLNSLRSGHSSLGIHVSLLHLIHTVLQLPKKIPSLFKMLKSSIPYSPPANHFKVKFKVQLRIHLIGETSLDLVWEAHMDFSPCALPPSDIAIITPIWVVSGTFLSPTKSAVLQTGIYLDLFCCPIYRLKKKTAHSSRGDSQ